MAFIVSCLLEPKERKGRRRRKGTEKGKARAKSEERAADLLAAHLLSRRSRAALFAQELSHLWLAERSVRRSLSPGRFAKNKFNLASCGSRQIVSHRWNEVESATIISTDHFTIAFSHTREHQKLADRPTVPAACSGRCAATSVRLAECSGLMEARVESVPLSNHGKRALVAQGKQAGPTNTHGLARIEPASLPAPPQLPPPSNTFAPRGTTTICVLAVT